MQLYNYIYIVRSILMSYNLSICTRIIYIYVCIYILYVYIYATIYIYIYSCMPCFKLHCDSHDLNIIFYLCY